MKSNNEVKTIPEGKGQFDMIDFQFEDSTSENAKNQLNMYMHPDGLYLCHGHILNKCFR